VGLIGPGLMGYPMARALRAAGADVSMYARRPAVRETLSTEGYACAASPAALAARVDLIIIIVTDTPAVEAVVAGSGGLLEALEPRHLVIDMGTTAVDVTRDLAARVTATGAAYLDAPVSGGQKGAEDATLSIMVGGPDQAVARAQPLFGVLGKRITHVGGAGAGQVAKAANQVIVGLTIEAVAEALTLARRAGVDPRRVREALAGGFADSRVLEVHGQRMVDGDFTPGARATVQHKDLHQALTLAATLGVSLPATALARDLYDRLIARGDGHLDHAALIRVMDDDATRPA